MDCQKPCSDFQPSSFLCFWSSKFQENNWSTIPCLAPCFLLGCWPLKSWLPEKLSRAFSQISFFSFLYFLEVSSFHIWWESWFCTGELVITSSEIGFLILNPNSQRNWQFRNTISLFGPRFLNIERISLSWQKLTELLRYIGMINNSVTDFLLSHLVVLEENSWPAFYFISSFATLSTD